MEIKVWVCPTEGCGNYYGTSGEVDLSTSIVGQHGQNYEPRPKEQWHSRAQCPDCRARGIKSERVLVELDVESGTSIPTRRLAATPSA